MKLYLPEYSQDWFHKLWTALQKISKKYIARNCLDFNIYKFSFLYKVQKNIHLKVIPMCYFISVSLFLCKNNARLLNKQVYWLGIVELNINASAWLEIYDYKIDNKQRVNNMIFTFKSSYFKLLLFCFCYAWIKCRLIN